AANGYYFLLHASFYANSLNSTLYVSSWRPGQAPFTATVSVPADDGLHKANVLQNQNYVPKFGGDAGNLWVIFHGYEGANVRGIFVRRSGDMGRTWSTPMNLIRNDPNATRYAFGLETVGAGTQGAYAVIVNNSGAAFVHWLHIARTQQITTAASPTNGCWWPQVLLDKKNTRNVHVYCRLPMVATSTDGNSFAPPVPLGPFNSWQLTATQGYHGHAVLSEDGALHWVVDGVTTFYRTGQFGDRDIYYRRYEPAPAAGARDMALKTTSLKNAGDGSGAESWDSMVVPASEALSPAKALTLMAWVRPMPGGPDTGTTAQLRPMIHRSGDRIGDPLFGIGSTGPDGARRPYAQIRTTRQTYFIEPPAWRSFLPETQMIHFALTFEADAGPNNVKLYMDGALVAQGTAQGEIAAGSGLMVFGYYGAWEIDDVRLWHRVLNGDFIRNMRQGPPSLEDGDLRAWWTFNDTTRDAKGANHGVLNYRESYAVSGAPSAAVLRMGGTTNAASGAAGVVTADSLATFYGAGITDTNYEATTLPLPQVLGQVRGRVRHRSGSTPMQLVFASPNQVNLLMPSGLPAGDGEVVMECPRGIIGQPIEIAAVEPGLFMVGAQRVAAGYGVRYAPDGSQSVMMAFDGALNPAPIELGAEEEQVWLTLFGTGFRAVAAPKATVGEIMVSAVAAAQGNFAGLDQVNIGPLPRALAGAGTIEVFIEAGGRRSNAVRIAIR
nr:hypothetical protein [Bryobacter sp.]